MSFGEGNLRERLAALEEVAAEMCGELLGLDGPGIAAEYARRLSELGVDVPGAPPAGAAGRRAADGAAGASGRLRALLDARGAAWAAEDGRRGARTLWACPAGECAFYEDAGNGYTRLEVRHAGWTVLSMESDMREPALRVTPGQAVRATMDLMSGCAGREGE